MSNLIFPDLPGAKPKIIRTPVHRTKIDDADSGQELRLRKFPVPRYRYEVEYDFLRSSQPTVEFQQIASFITRHGGRHDAFLWRDPEDYQVSGHGFGLGDGTSRRFRLQRALGGTYTDRLGTWDFYSLPRTNFALRSSDEANASVVKTACTVPSSSIAPDGSMDMKLICEDTSASTTHYTSRTMSGLEPGYATFSRFVKGAGRGVELRLSNGSGGGGVAFNLTGSGSVITATSWGTGFTGMTGTITAIGSGFFVTATMLVPGGTTTAVTLLWNYAAASSSYTGDGSSGAWVWHAQVEKGQEATHPITTTTGALTEAPGYWAADQTTGSLVAPSSESPFEPVTEADWASVTIYAHGITQTAGSDFTYDASGLVVFGSPQWAGCFLTWSGSYLKRVRFDDDEPRFERVLPGYWRATLTFESVLT